MTFDIGVENTGCLLVNHFMLGTAAGTVKYKVRIWNNSDKLEE